MAKRSFCDGWARRDFLRVGAAGAFGLNLSISRMLEAAAKGDIDKSKSDINFVFIFLKGGLSTIDTFDMKPARRARFAGRSIPSHPTCRAPMWASTSLRRQR